jgi:hypothetical protein
VELETGNDSSTDLAGDAGVVGRWLVQQGAEAGAQPELQLDLKGVLYQASVVWGSFSFPRQRPHH